MAQITYRLNILLLFLCLIHPLQAQKRITVSIQGEKTLKEIFGEIEQQTGYSFAYNCSAFPVDEKRKAVFERLSLSETLHRLLAGSGFTFKIKGKHILIVKTRPPQHVPVQDLRGKVLDAQTREPVFATVLLLHPELSGQGTATDSLGNFHIGQLPVGRYALQISAIGYEPVTVTDILLNSAKEGYCEVALTENTQHLQEIVVRAPVSSKPGYGE